MDANAAQAMLESFSDWYSEPALTPSEQAALVADLALVEDSEGRQPDDVGYEATYNVDSVTVQVHEAWKTKLSKTAEYHEGDEYRIRQNVEAMERYWAARLASLTTQSGLFRINVGYSDTYECQ